MRKLLKILNPFIWLWNQFNYDAHLYGQSITRQATKDKHEYEPYDFNKDTDYF